MSDRQKYDEFIWALIFSLTINLLFVFALLSPRDGAKSSRLPPFVVSFAMNQQVHTGEHTVHIGTPPLPTPAKKKIPVEPPTTSPPLHSNDQLPVSIPDSYIETTIKPESVTNLSEPETDLPPIATAGESGSAPLAKETVDGLSIFGDKIPRDHYTSPEFLGGETPPYPKRAKRNSWEGTVLLSLSINASGEVTKVGIVKTSGYDLLDQQARASVSSWRFKPARRNGIAIAVTVQQPIIFRSTLLNNDQ